MYLAGMTKPNRKARRAAASKAQPGQQARPLDRQREREVAFDFNGFCAFQTGTTFRFTMPESEMANVRKVAAKAKMEPGQILLALLVDKVVDPAAPIYVVTVPVPVGVVLSNGRLVDQPGVTSMFIHQGDNPYDIEAECDDEMVTACVTIGAEGAGN